MTELFAAVSGRLKTIFTAHAALELEAELILAHIERRASFLRQAAQLEQEGFADLAGELRRHAQEMDPSRPAESVLSTPARALTCTGQKDADSADQEGSRLPAPVAGPAPQKETPNGSARKKSR